MWRVEISFEGHMRRDGLDCAVEGCGGATVGRTLKIHKSEEGI